MSPEVLAFAKKLAEGARAKALEDQRRLAAIRKARAEQDAAHPVK
ncbi:MAG TPA: hypothetical protein VFT88_02975 [Acidobacteriaceae bacterium]|jgi:hypothetical protein|nr:hypothetical protein [Acidobacteriaceae bacterium]